MKSFSCKKIKTKTVFFSFILLAFNFLLSCKKFIEVEAPETSINGGNVYANDATAAAVLTDIYARLSEQNNSTNSNYLSTLSWFAALSADELTLHDQNYIPFINHYTNSLNSSNTSQHFWSNTYPIIFIANSAIAGLNSTTTLTESVRKQLLGEAKFIRGFCYFYLVNLYGDVPLILSTDYKLNSQISRTAKTQVYGQIIQDLKDAQNLMSDNYFKADVLTPYPSGTEERVRPTKWAATALLSRVYLYTKDWANAEAQVTAVINNSSLFTLETLANAFKKNNKEAIWQLQPIFSGVGANTGDGKLFILPNGGPNTSGTYPVYLRNNVLNMFEPNDLRKQTWTDSVKPGSVAYYFPSKYKVGNINTSTSEYVTVIRLAELYLIRSEARARQNNIAGSKDDLFAIRRRAGLLDATLTANDEASLLTAIIHERQVELFTEWGHRWFDLKRMGKVDAIMEIITPMKSGTWQTTDQLYPIPQSDIDKAPQIIQNPGY